MNRLFRHWGATPQRIADSMKRPLLDGTEEVLGNGTPMVPVSTLEMGGGPLPVAPQSAWSS